MSAVPLEGATNASPTTSGANVNDWPHGAAFSPIVGDAKSKWLVEKKLGRGAFATTYHVKLNPDFGGELPLGATEGAMKVILVRRSASDVHPELRESNHAAVLAEVQQLQNIAQHAMFPTLYDSEFVSSESGEWCLIVMEYCDGLDLWHEVYRRRRLNPAEGHFPKANVEVIFIQLLCALYHLHRSSVTHRDVKPGNALVTRRGLVKLGDFGMASLRNRQTAFTGTLEYMAPEVFGNQGYDFKVDIWAFGVLMFEVMTLDRPYKTDGDRTAKQMLEALRQPRPPLFSMTHKYPWIAEYTPDMLAIIDRMLSRDPKMRPSAGDILSEPFVQTILQQFAVDVWWSHMWARTPERIADPTLAPEHLPMLQDPHRCILRREAEYVLGSLSNDGVIQLHVEDETTAAEPAAEEAGDAASLPGASAAGPEGGDEAADATTGQQAVVKEPSDDGFGDLALSEDAPRSRAGRSMSSFSEAEPTRLRRMSSRPRDSTVAETPPLSVSTVLSVGRAPSENQLLTAPSVVASRAPTQRAGVETPTADDDHGQNVATVLEAVLAGYAPDVTLVNISAVEEVTRDMLEAECFADLDQLKYQLQVVAGVSNGEPESIDADEALLMEMNVIPPPRQPRSKQSSSPRSAQALPLPPQPQPTASMSPKNANATPQSLMSSDPSPLERASTAGSPSALKKNTTPAAAPQTAAQSGNADQSSPTTSTGGRSPTPTTSEVASPAKPAPPPAPEQQRDTTTTVNHPSEREPSPTGNEVQHALEDTPNQHDTTASPSKTQTPHAGSTRRRRGDSSAATPFDAALCERTPSESDVDDGVSVVASSNSPGQSTRGLLAADEALAGTQHQPNPRSSPSTAGGPSSRHATTVTPAEGRRAAMDRKLAADRTRRRVVESEEAAERSALEVVLMDEWLNDVAPPLLQQHEEPARRRWIEQRWAEEVPRMAAATAVAALGAALDVPGCAFAPDEDLVSIEASALQSERVFSEYFATTFTQCHCDFIAGREQLERRDIERQQHALYRGLRERAEELAVEATFDSAGLDILCEHVIAEAPAPRVAPPPQPLDDGGDDDAADDAARNRERDVSPSRRQFVYAPPPLQLETPSKETSEAAAPQEGAPSARRSKPERPQSAAQRDAVLIMSQLSLNRAAQTYVTPSPRRPVRPTSARPSSARASPRQAPSSARSDDSDSRTAKAALTTLRTLLAESENPNGASSLPAALRDAARREAIETEAAYRFASGARLADTERRPPLVPAPPPTRQQEDPRPASAAVRSAPGEPYAGASANPSARPVSKPSQKRPQSARRMSDKQRRDEEVRACIAYSGELKRVHSVVTQAPSALTGTAVSRMLKQLRPVELMSEQDVRNDMRRKRKAQRKAAKREAKAHEAASQDPSRTDEPLVLGDEAETTAADS